MFLKRLNGKYPLIILIFLIISPVVGKFVWWFQIFVPMARTFDQPVDAPPFAESLLPLFGMLNIFIGIFSLFFYFSPKRNYKVLLPFVIFNIVYNSLGLLIWLIFFGCRFVRFFPIMQFGFYFAFLEMVLPHLLWIILLIWCVRSLRRIVVPVKVPV